MPHMQAAHGLTGDPPASIQQAASPSVRSPGLALLWFNCALCSVTKCKTRDELQRWEAERPRVEPGSDCECGLGCPLVF